MKVRGSDKKAEKIEPQMAPMIDVVFQLLIFFMLTLKITPQEGNFDINMPIGQSSSSAPDVDVDSYRVQLIAKPDGTLGNILFNNVALGVGDQAYERLNQEMARAVGYKAGAKPLKDDVEVEIDADYNLHYRYTIKAVGACKGRMTSAGTLDPYVEKIKFAPPEPPGGAAG